MRLSPAGQPSGSPTYGIQVPVRSASGQGLAEYALILALIAIAAVFALLFLSGVISSILSLIGHKI